MKKIIMIFALLGTTACTVVHPGESGVVFNKFTGSLRSETPGVVFWVPGRVVEAYPISLRTYSMVQRSEEGSNKGDDSIDLPSAEGQHVKLDISITYNTAVDKAVEVFKAFHGEDIGDIEATFIRRTTITIAQNVAGSMSLTELISTKRDVLQTEITKRLGEELLKMGFVLDKVNLGAVHLPPSVEEQMQHKMAAQQEAQRAEYELQKQEVLAKAKVAQTEGEAKARVIQAKAEAEAQKLLQVSTSAQVLQLKAIEKWNGVTPTIMGGTGGGMLFNIPLGSK